MILCPNCLHRELTGALFCSECGAQLLFRDGVPTSSVTTGTHKKGAEPAYVGNGGVQADTAVPSTKGLAVALEIINNEELLSLTGRDEVTLGRVSEGQPVIPDIDLTPFKAFEAGVSRMHASLDLRNNQASITDLGSANGTRINGRKIVAQTPYQLKHMDILTLGKFKIRVIFRSVNGG